MNTFSGLHQPFMGYHEIKFYDLIESNSNLDIRQHFVKNWKIFIDDCEIPGELLTILNSVNNDIQFSMELSDKNLLSLDILKTKLAKKIWINTYSKLTNSKHICFLPFETRKTLP